MAEDAEVKIPMMLQGVEQTANVITYRGRSAARGVGKALGFAPEVVARLSGLIGRWEWKGPDDTFPEHFRRAST